jgi:hypothetical protein
MLSQTDLAAVPGRRRMRRQSILMADDGAVPYGRKTQHTPAIDEVHVLWITAGLGCDGDTVSITGNIGLDVP